MWFLYLYICLATSICHWEKKVEVFASKEDCMSFINRADLPKLGAAYECRIGDH